MRFVVLCVVVLCFWSCSSGPTTGEPTNTDSHWLEYCVSDETCGDLSCHLGVCTKLCVATSNCKGLVEASCASLVDEISDEQAQLCTLSCDSDQTCQLLNGDMRCQNNVCVLDDWRFATSNMSTNNTSNNALPDDSVTQWKHERLDGGFIVSTSSGLCDVSVDGQDVLCFGSVNQSVVRVPDGVDRTRVLGVEQCGWGLSTDGELVQWGLCSLNPPESDARVLQWSVMDDVLCILTEQGQILCQNTQVQIPLNEQVLFKSIGFNDTTTCGLSTMNNVYCMSNDLEIYQVEGLFKQLSTGFGSRICGVRQNDRIYCWENASDITEQMPTPSSITQLITGKYFWCAHHREGIVCGGKLMTQSDIMDFSALYHTSTFVCGQTQSNELRCWGSK